MATLTVDKAGVTGIARELVSTSESVRDGFPKGPVGPIVKTFSTDEAAAKMLEAIRATVEARFDEGLEETKMTAGAFHAAVEGYARADYEGSAKIAALLHGLGAKQSTGTGDARSHRGAAGKATNGGSLVGSGASLPVFGGDYKQAALAIESADTTALSALSDQLGSFLSGAQTRITETVDTLKKSIPEVWTGMAADNAVTWLERLNTEWNKRRFREYVETLQTSLSTYVKAFETLRNSHPRHADIKKIEDAFTATSDSGQKQLYRNLMQELKQDSRNALESYRNSVGQAVSSAPSNAKPPPSIASKAADDVLPPSPRAGAGGPGTTTLGGNKKLGNTDNPNQNPDQNQNNPFQNLPDMSNQDQNADNSDNASGDNSENANSGNSNSNGSGNSAPTSTSPNTSGLTDDTTEDPIADTEPLPTLGDNPYTGGGGGGGDGSGAGGPGAIVTPATPPNLTAPQRDMGDRRQAVTVAHSGMPAAPRSTAMNSGMPMMPFMPGAGMGGQGQGGGEHKTREGLFEEKEMLSQKQLTGNVMVSATIGDKPQILPAEATQPRTATA